MRERPVLSGTGLGVGSGGTTYKGPGVGHMLGRQQRPLAGTLWKGGGAIIDADQGARAGPGGRGMGGEVREQWLKLCAQGGKMEQEVRALWRELRGDLRGELEITVWDLWLQLCGQGGR